MASLLIQYLRNQLKRGFSPVCLVVGRQRTGKTWLAMKIAHTLDPSWTGELMTFKIENFVDIYNKYNKKVIILDEAGVTLDPYEHATIQQRVYNHIIQTQAYKQNIVFLVLPFASEIGKQHRKHVDLIIEVLGRGVYKLYRTRSWRSDLSQKPPRLETIEIVSGVDPPPKHIIDWYMSEGQKIYKESILAMQTEAMELRKNKGKKKQEEIISVA